MKRIPVLLCVMAMASGCLSHHVPRATSDVDFTYKIGWWPYQSDLTVETLTTDVADSRLNLFNSTSLIRIKMKGTMHGSKGWEPRIAKVHIAEEVIVGGNFTNSLAQIRLKPIIEVREKTGYAGTPISYDLTQELQLQSMGWGSNRYQIACGGITNEIALIQRK